MTYDKPKQLTLTQNISLVSSEIEAKALEAFEREFCQPSLKTLQNLQITPQRK
jgi:hypothetical protein